MSGEGLRAVMRRFPTGVAVLTVEASGQRVGLTVATLSTLSLEPPLVGVAVSRQAAAHELLREAKAFALTLLAADQEDVAAHFARGVPPIAMWSGVAVEPGEGAPLLSGGVGWLTCSLSSEIAVGTHTIFVGLVMEASTGPGERALVRLEGGYRPA